ncbi:MAG: hypothetical protein O3B13_04855 [Planctomycetota bacterium]|nr:hypothetical protein [Planctomycetota bacterium]
MQINVHDNLAVANSRRDRFIRDRVDECLSRFSPRLHQVSISLSEIGHHRGENPDVSCRISASAGSLGDFAVTAHSEIVHQAIAQSLKQLTRAIDRKIGKRLSRRHVVTGMELESDNVTDEDVLEEAELI